MKYIVITILAPLKYEDQRETRGWFNMPRETLFAADVIKQSVDELKTYTALGGVSIERAIKERGWPKVGNWSLAERIVGFFKVHFHKWRQEHGYLP